MAKVPLRLLEVAAALSSGALDLAPHLEADPVAALRGQRPADAEPDRDKPARRLAPRHRRELADGELGTLGSGAGGGHATVLDRLGQVQWCRTVGQAGDHEL